MFQNYIIPELQQRNVINGIVCMRDEARPLAGQCIRLMLQ